MSSKDLDLNSDIMSEHQSEGSGGARVSDFCTSDDFHGAVEEVRDSGEEKIMVEQVVHVSGGENLPVRSVLRSEVGGGFDGTKGEMLGNEERRDGTEEVREGRGFDASKDKLSNEERKNGIEVVVKSTEAVIEETHLGGEGGLAAERNEEVSNLEDRVFVTDVLDGDSSRPDINESTQVQDVCGSAEESVIREANADICEKFNSVQNEEHETVPQVAETVSERAEGSERLSHREDNPEGGAYLAVGANSVVAEVEDIVSESVAEAQNVGVPVSKSSACTEEENRTIEPEIEAEEAVAACQPDECHTAGSHFSSEAVAQFMGKESNMGTLVVDLDSCFNAEGKQNNGIEIPGKDICISVQSHGQGADSEDMGVDVGAPIQEHSGNKIHYESRDINLLPLEHETPMEKENWANYCLATDKEGEFFVSDLVWGKVKSHPWWPGQIFDPSDASEQALKYHKKDRFLVAYFGDQTFAWNEALSLRPFRTHFAQMEKQSSLEAFRGAVGSALDEVSRRVQLGLSCSCTPEEVHAEIKSQIIHNSGVREEVCQSDVRDKSFGITSFEPDKLVEYIKALAVYPCGRGDLLELVIAQAQLVTFYQWKGYFGLPEFHVYGGLLDDDIEHATPIIKNEEQASPGKRKMRRRYNSFRRSCEYILEDDMNPLRKKRSLSELMGGNNSSLDHVDGVKRVVGEKGASRSASALSGNKRKAAMSFSNETVMQHRKKRHFRSRGSNSKSPTPISSKVGERIRRIASQLTGSAEKSPKGAVKADQSNEKLNAVGVLPHSTRGLQRQRSSTGRKYSSADEMLSQLCLAARDPMKGYSFLTTIVDFFTDYRDLMTVDNSSFLKKPVSGESCPRNIKPSKSKTKSRGTENYRSVNECYLSDENIQSSQEEQKSLKSRKRQRSYQLETPTKKDGPLEATASFKSDPSLQCEGRLTVESENHFQPYPNVDSKQQGPGGNGNLVMEKTVVDLNEKDVGDISPTALILNFTEANSIPSEMDLNKIFSRFGALKESETEILRKGKRAKVVFQSRNDAEVAFSSAGKFSIFGPTLVSYQLRYLTSTPSKASPRATRQSMKNAASS